MGRQRRSAARVAPGGRGGPRAGRRPRSLTTRTAGTEPALTLHVALIEPQIPPNAGNIARLCAATDVPLHLIGPLGFRLDDPSLRRAGIDCWAAVEQWVHPSWRDFREAMARERCLYFSAHARTPFWQAPYASGCCLVFGNETDGMPERIREKHPERLFRIPMTAAVRSLNLATAVGIVLYEAIRQTGGLVDEPRAAPLMKAKGSVA